MKKFEFKLSTVHKVREMKEEKETAKLASLRSEVQEAEQLIEEIESARMDVMNKYLDGLQSGMPLNAAELDLYSKHFATLERRRIEAEEELKEKRNACSEQTRVLAEAAKGVKITETLRDKQKSRYDLERSKKEQTALDEITSAKFANNKSTEQQQYDVS